MCGLLIVQSWLIISFFLTTFLWQHSININQDFNHSCIHAVIYLCSYVAVIWANICVNSLILAKTWFWQRVLVFASVRCGYANDMSAQVMLGSVASRKKTYRFQGSSHLCKSLLQFMGGLVNSPNTLVKQSIQNLWGAGYECFHWYMLLLMFPDWMSQTFEIWKQRTSRDIYDIYWIY